MNELFTWELLITFAGCTGAAAMLTQFIKNYVKLDPQLISCIIAVVIMVIANIFVKGWNIQDFVLSIINGIICGLGASGGYDVVHRLSNNTKN